MKLTSVMCHLRRAACQAVRMIYIRHCNYFQVNWLTEIATMPLVIIIISYYIASRTGILKFTGIHISIYKDIVGGLLLRRRLFLCNS